MRVARLAPTLGLAMNHGDGADGASFGADAMADAFVAVDDHGLAADHAENIAFGADHGAGGAADAVIVIDVRVLGLRAVRAKFAFFSGGSGGGVFLLFLAKMEIEERTDDGGGD